MICPVCNKDALTVEYENIELDYCPNCGGVWFDAGELDLLLEAAGLGNERSFLQSVANSPEVKTGENKLRCPVCRRKMKKVMMEEHQKIVTDICIGEHGIWFDGGEIAALVQAMADKGPDTMESKKALGYIKEMFKYQKK